MELKWCEQSTHDIGSSTHITISEMYDFTVADALLRILECLWSVYFKHSFVIFHGYIRRQDELAFLQDRGTWQDKRLFISMINKAVMVIIIMHGLFNYLKEFWNSMKKIICTSMTFSHKGNFKLLKLRNICNVTASRKHQKTRRFWGFSTLNHPIVCFWTEPTCLSS